MGFKNLRVLNMCEKISRTQKLFSFLIILVSFMSGCSDSSLNVDMRSSDPQKPDRLDQMVSQDLSVETTDMTSGSLYDLDIVIDAEITSDMEINQIDQSIDESCNPVEVLARNGCSSGGCHATPVQANLDLISPGFETTLLNAVSPTEGCEGRLIIDVRRPEQSLMLQVIGVSPPLGGEIDPCQTIMPPGGTISEEDQTCLNEWVHTLAHDAQDSLPPPPPFEPTSLFSAVRKVKTLLHGDIPTEDEFALVDADQTRLRMLITDWVETDAFENKLGDFFEVALQQRRQSEDLQQFDRLRRSGFYSSGYIKVLEESFVRTAIDLIKRNQPFTQIATTRRWMVTTANLVLLRYPDQEASDRQQRHTVVGNPDDAPSNLRRQISQRTWLIPSIESPCEFAQPEVLDMFFGIILSRRCPNITGNIRLTDSPLTQNDFEDWRLVEFVPASEEPELPLLPFYDLVSLRSADRVATRLPRVGFFTTSVFLNNWATNVDNQFRVTANQSLLVALNIGFSSSEPTQPLRVDGLDANHAEPTTACYGCHKLLDPMRLYFGKEFNVSYQLPTNESDDQVLFEDELTPSFAFRNYQTDGGDTYQFAEILTEHPRFPYAWVQKLCLYANSKRCDERDPLFIDIAERFRDQGYNFKTLVIDLFSSPLITGLEETESQRNSDPLISITRLNHLCPLLAERTGWADICDVNRVRSVKGLIARDDFARGAVDATQPALSSAFHFAAVEAICNEVASTVVRGNSEFFSHQDPDVLSKIVSRFMGIPVTHERYEHTLTLLTTHFDTLRAAGRNINYSTRSVFSLACMSPDVMGIGL
jgi:hypothetical protein